MCSRLLYPIDAMPFDATDSRGICDVTAERDGLAALLSIELANSTREAHRSATRQKVFALIGGNDCDWLARGGKGSRAKI
jgi:hypothetical protein